MAKKKTKVKTGKYKDFKLHGDYPRNKVLAYIAVDCIISLTLGVILQPYIIRAVASALAAY